MSELAIKLMGSAVRFFGFILMLFGLWVALIVMWEAQELYDNPKAIEKLAQHIEKGSNIDAGLVSVSESDKKINKDADKNKNIRVSYFFAWIVAILLLLLIARIALGAIKTGGELVLFDVHIKRFAKELAKESMRSQK